MQLEEKNRENRINFLTSCSKYGNRTYLSWFYPISHKEFSNKTMKKWKIRETNSKSFWRVFHSDSVPLLFFDMSAPFFYFHTLTFLDMDICVDRPQSCYSNCRRSGTQSIHLVCIAVASLGTPLSLPASSKCVCVCVCVCERTCHLKQVHCNTTNKSKTLYVFIAFVSSHTFLGSVCWTGKHFLKKPLLEQREDGYCTKHYQHEHSPSKSFFSTTD